MTRVATTARSVTFSWNTIECILRNGMITSYMAQLFNNETGLQVPGDTDFLARNFTANDLTPYTDYRFTVAGVNSGGTGPFSDDISFTTLEDGNNNIC